FVAYPPGWTAQGRRAARVQFFGGGYNHGDPDAAIGAARSWAKRAGYVGIAPDYRVNDRFGSSPVAVADDNRLVIKWIMDNAAMLGVDPLRVVVAGGSSGGGSAFFAALPEPPATTDPASTPPFPVAAVSIRSGAIEVGVGDGTFASPSTDYFFPVSNEISPARNLKAGMPPVIMIHG
ncbi:MAG: alpha/beta hydrolase, partial [Nevskia sp.]|uniref:alpha/beta hydrolase n=1 Tax=Nevskia sp. TaxID=1929292 RepID=UPI0040371C96